MKILITRDASQSGGLEEKLKTIGASVICVPTISIEDPDDWSAFDRVAPQVDQFHWIIFSSANAVLQTKKRLDYLGISLSDHPQLRFAAVGSQTAQLMEEAGWKVDVVPKKFQSEGLASALQRKEIFGKKIWFPRALQARNYLIQSLSSAGAEVIMTPVYQNRIPLENRPILRQTMEEHSIDWITFTSASTVDNFVQLLEELPDRDSFPKIASIGQKTTEALLKHGLTPIFTAVPQTLDGLVYGIKDWKKENHE